jgi:uncharacterized protein
MADLEGSDESLKTQSPKISAEVFAIPLDADRFLIYAPGRRAAFVGNSAIVNRLADLNEGTANLISTASDEQLLEFLRRLEIVDAGPEPFPITSFQGEPEPVSLTLFLTTACNLRCTYCYASAGDTPASFMSPEIAKRGIDYVALNARRQGLTQFDITYHGGGEPTVHWKVMVDSLDYARGRGRALGLDVRAYTATNGVLSNSQVDWVIGNLSGASLSYDGLPSAHDQNRLTVLGQGSSERVVHTIRRFDDAGFPYGLRLTVTADQIASLPLSIEYICSNFKPRRIQVEPAYQLGRWAAGPSAESESFIAAFRAARAVAVGNGLDIFFSAARVGHLSNHFCGVTQDTFALSPDGNVSACYEVFSEGSPWADKFFYATPDPNSAGYRFDLDRLHRLRQQAVQFRGFCSGCYAKWHCGGDCYHKSLAVNGDAEFAGTDRCHITRELTKDQILERISAAGGIFWHEPPGSARGVMEQSVEGGTREESLTA